MQKIVGFIIVSLFVSSIAFWGGDGKFESTIIESLNRPAVMFVGGAATNVNSTGVATVTTDQSGSYILNFSESGTYVVDVTTDGVLINSSSGCNSKGPKTAIHHTYTFPVPQTGTYVIEVTSNGVVMMAAAECGKKGV